MTAQFDATQYENLLEDSRKNSVEYLMRSPCYPDLVMVARRVPQGVLCLISALSFHEWV
jgi:hypothetical protein